MSGMVSEIHGLFSSARAGGNPPSARVYSSPCNQGEGNARRRARTPSRENPLPNPLAGGRQFRSLLPGYDSTELVEVREREAASRERRGNDQW